jgi:hypothetical protein
MNHPSNTGLDPAGNDGLLAIATRRADGTAEPGSDEWWQRMFSALRAAADEEPVSRRTDGLVALASTRADHLAPRGSDEWWQAVFAAVRQIEGLDGDRVTHDDEEVRTTDVIELRTDAPIAAGPDPIVLAEPRQPAEPAATTAVEEQDPTPQPIVMPAPTEVIWATDAPVQAALDPVDVAAATPAVPPPAAVRRVRAPRPEKAARPRPDSSDMWLRCRAALSLLVLVAFLSVALAAVVGAAVFAVLLAVRGAGG